MSNVATFPASASGESSTLQACKDYLLSISAFDLSAILILMTAVLTGPSEWYIATPVCAAGVAAIVVPPLRRSKRMWLMLTCLIATYDLLHWYEADNHKYLLAYAMLAVWISLHIEDHGAAMAKSARWLLAATFCCATAWKLAAEDFASGEFFVWTMVFDQRFAGMARWLIGVTPEMQAANSKALSSITHWEGLSHHEVIKVAPSIVTWARGMAMWTVLIEFLVALAFLVPSRFAFARFASPLLLVFVITTYALAPVLGFGYLLLALGVAVETRLNMRLAFLATFIALRVHTIPWGTLGDRFLGV